MTSADGPACAMQTCRQQSEALVELFPPNPETSWLLLTCPRVDYSASHIARAVEDCDAHLLNLNVLAESPEPGMVAVSIRVGRRNALGVVRSLARYGYKSVPVDNYGFGRPLDDDEA